MTHEEAVEIIRAALPKHVYVPYRTVFKRSGKGMTTEQFDLSIEEEAEQSQGMSIDGHVLNQEELIEYITTIRALYQAEFDRKHEAFRMLCEGE